MELCNVIIVGQNPSNVENSGSIKRLWKWTQSWGLENWTFINCSDDVGQKYTIDYERLKEASTYDRVIALGNVASDALKKVGVDHFKMPHPSGLNRQLNDKSFEESKVKECYNYLYT